MHIALIFQVDLEVTLPVQFTEMNDNWQKKSKQTFLPLAAMHVSNMLEPISYSSLISSGVIVLTHTAWVSGPINFISHVQVQPSFSNPLAFIAWLAQVIRLMHPFVIGEWKIK